MHSASAEYNYALGIVRITTMQPASCAYAHTLGLVTIPMPKLCINMDPFKATSTVPHSSISLGDGRPPLIVHPLHKLHLVAEPEQVSCHLTSV
jgi:hypothetical protein